MRSLKLRYGSSVALFFLGAISIGYIGLRYDNRIAILLEPLWLVISSIMMLYSARCPRCRWPANAALLRIGNRRVCVPVGGLSDRCPSCDLDLRVPYKPTPTGGV